MTLTILLLIPSPRLHSDPDLTSSAALPPAHTAVTQHLTISPPLPPASGALLCRGRRRWLPTSQIFVTSQIFLTSCAALPPNLRYQPNIPYPRVPRFRLFCRLPCMAGVGKDSKRRGGGELSIGSGVPLPYTPAMLRVARPSPPWLTCIGGCLSQSLCLCLSLSLSLSQSLSLSLSRHVCVCVCVFVSVHKCLTTLCRRRARRSSHTRKNESTRRRPTARKEEVAAEGGGLQE